jgi:hypothetical protein
MRADQVPCVKHGQNFTNRQGLCLPSKEISQTNLVEQSEFLQILSYHKRGHYLKGYNYKEP